jgi:hypothetical protein
VKQRNATKQPYRGTYTHGLPCECGKRGYGDRRAAKDVIREMRRQGKVRSESARIDAYRCDVDPDYWHVGHSRPYQVGPDLNDPTTWHDGLDEGGIG